MCLLILNAVSYESNPVGLPIKQVLSCLRLCSIRYASAYSVWRSPRASQAPAVRIIFRDTTLPRYTSLPLLASRPSTKCRRRCILRSRPVTHSLTLAGQLIARRACVSLVLVCASGRARARVQTSLIRRATLANERSGFDGSVGDDN